jgi:hypothetical protein
MRCFFIRGGDVVAAEELTGLSDEEAIAKAHVLFSERKNLFEGFEVWDLARKLIAHPHLTSPENSATSLFGNSDGPGST